MRYSPPMARPESFGELCKRLEVPSWDWLAGESGVSRQTLYHLRDGANRARKPTVLALAWALNLEAWEPLAAALEESCRRAAAGEDIGPAMRRDG